MSARCVCERCKLRVTQLCLPSSIDGLTSDAEPPRLSPIPASVTALSLSPHLPERDDAEAVRCWAALSAAAASDWQDKMPWRLPHPSPSLQSCEEEGKEWVLRLSENHNHPLQPGSLPSTLTFLQLGWQFDQPLVPGVLPASLLQLSVTSQLEQHHELLQGLLPASLERLRLWSWPHLLQAGEWPPALKALHLGTFDQLLVPDVLTSSLLFLSFDDFNHPLVPGVLPPCLVELRVGDSYDYPLPPSVLPSSLRSLSLRGAFCQPLQVGSLPEGLLFLRLHPDSDVHLYHPLQPPLQPGVLPSTLRAIDFTDRQSHPIPAGIIPLSVRWVRLWSRYRDEDIEAVPPAHAECTWFEVIALIWFALVHEPRHIAIYRAYTTLTHSMTFCHQTTVAS